MGNYYAEDVEYLLLKAVSECREPVGAGFLAETFASRNDMALSEAAIGRHLRRLEQKGYLCCERYNGRSRGRVITKKGSDRMKELAAGQKQVKAVADVMEVLRDGSGRSGRTGISLRRLSVSSTLPQWKSPATTGTFTKPLPSTTRRWPACL